MQQLHDSGKSYTSFNMPFESWHSQVDHKCLSLVFVGVGKRHVLACILKLSLFVAFDDIGVLELRLLLHAQQYSGLTRIDGWTLVFSVSSWRKFVQQLECSSQPKSKFETSISSFRMDTTWTKWISNPNETGSAPLDTSKCKKIRMDTHWNLHEIIVPQVETGYQHHILEL